MACHFSCASSTIRLPSVCPSEPKWDDDRVAVEFDELLPGETVDRVVEYVDNLARSAHAQRIIERHRKRLQLRCSGAVDLWNRRAQIFPHLLFGPDVEDHLGALSAGFLPTLINRLADLHRAAADWAGAGGDAPPWTCKVTPESTSVMNHPKRREARRFGSVRGERLLFEWHARCGDGVRIHLRFDAGTREIEIGYIGVHLPL